MKISQFLLSHLKLYMFFVFWIFYFNILPPLFVEEFNNPLALNLTLLTLLFFTLGYCINLNRKKTEIGFNLDYSKTYKLYYLYVPLLFLSSVFHSLFTPLFAILSGHLLIHHLNKKEYYTTLFILILSFINLFFQFTRMYLLMMVLYIFMYYYLKSKKLYLFQIILLGISSLFLLITMLYQRVFGEINFVKIFTYLSGIKTSEFFKLIDNYYVYEAYLNVLEFFPKKIDYLYGESIFKPLFFWIPRSIWENKTEELTTFLGKLFYGSTRGSEYSTGMTLTGEFYLNFGVLGVIVFSLLLGLLSSFLLNKLLSTNKEYIIMSVLMFIVYFPHIARGGISLSVISLFLFTFVFMIFFKTSHLYKKIKI